MERDLERERAEALTAQVAYWRGRSQRYLRAVLDARRVLRDEDTDGALEILNVALEEETL